MKRILITGASSGIGLQLAFDYVADGWHVIACGRNASKLQQALDEQLSLHTAQLEIRVFDTGDKRATAAALLCLPPLDLVILNAGSCEYVDDACNFDVDLFNRVMKTNVTGTVNCIAAIVPQLPAGSRLAIVGSAVTLLPLTRSEAYGASKAALDYLARTLDIDLAPQQIGVSLIRPGFVDTPLTRKNNFPMPGRISKQRASRYIRRGLKKGRREISFPTVFILCMRLLALLPGGLWKKIAVSMARKDL